MVHRNSHRRKAVISAKDLRCRFPVGLNELTLMAEDGHPVVAGICHKDPPVFMDKHSLGAGKPARAGTVTDGTDIVKLAVIFHHPVIAGISDVKMIL